MSPILPAADLQADSRFGICAEGICLLLAIGQSAEFMADIAVYPIPRVANRLRGAAQVRGHPVLVFSADVSAPTKLPILQRCSIVMITSHDAALQVGQAPLLLDNLEFADAQPPQVSFANQLGRPYRARVVNLSIEPAQDPRIWWEADFEGLFKALAND
jgi:hypothetical protein